jgi:hypothetical protein
VYRSIDSGLAATAALTLLTLSHISLAQPAPPAEPPSAPSGVADPTTVLPGATEQVAPAVPSAEPAAAPATTPAVSTPTPAAIPSSAVPVESAAPPVAASSEPAAAPAATVLPWYDNLSVGGGVVLYYYQPTEGPAKNNLSVFFANLLLDAHWDAFALHLEPRFRDSKLRSYFDGPAWLQEAYASGTLGPVTIKVGKEYKQLGLFWDNSFYGNIQVYDGLKLDPNYGISVEGKTGVPFGVDFSAQYFVVDGGSNVSLANRDTLYIPGARRRNAFVGRVAPTYQFDGGEAHVGLSAEHFEADLPVGQKGVTRVAAEAKVTYLSFGAWAEGLLQKGRHVTDFPFAGNAVGTVLGQASADNRYLLVGAEYGVGPVTLRYNVSFANYHDVHVSEIMHVPGVGFRINPHLSVLAEFVDWKRHGDIDSDVDESVNVTLSGSL